MSVSASDHYTAALRRLADELDLDVTSRILAVDVDPVDRVHCLVAGEGPPVVLLHGLGVGATSWLPLVAELSDQVLCYAIDRPGRGRSDPLDHTTVDFRTFNARLHEAVLTALDIDACPVLGNSFGGFQAMLLALDRPDLLESLVLLGAPAGLSGRYPLRMRLGSIPIVGPWLVGLAEPDDVAGAREVFGRVAVLEKTALSEPFLAAYLAEIDQPGTTESLASVFRDSLRLRGARPAYVIRDEATGIGHRSLFVWGSEDQFFPPAVGRPVARAMPDARFVELLAAGHAPWLEPDDRAARAVRSFLTSG